MVAGLAMEMVVMAAMAATGPAMEVVTVDGLVTAVVAMKSLQPHARLILPLLLQ